MTTLTKHQLKAQQTKASQEVSAVKPLLEALQELVRCVRGGDETSGALMDDALMDADDAIFEAKAIVERHRETEKAAKRARGDMAPAR